MIEILTGIVAIAKAIPALSNMFDKLVLLWINSKNASVEKESEELKQERRKIVEQYNKAKNDDERKKYFKDFIINNSK